MARVPWSARALVTCSSWLAPADTRAGWRREWLAEVQAVAAAGQMAPMRFALGAPRHALALRVAAWRPSLVLADVRYGVRWLRHRPLFAATSIGTLAIGIGAVTAMFAIVYGILMKPLPYRDPSRLVQLWEANPLFNWTEATIAPGNAISWRERNHVFEAMAWYSGSASRAAGTADLTLDGDPPQHVLGMGVEANFFDVLGAPAVIGRTFAPGEDVPGKQHEIVVSDAFWRTHFDADRSVIGRQVRLNGVGFTVIGVMPASFHFDLAPADLWLPLAVKVDDLREVRRPHWMRVVARLKPGVTIAAAQADLTSIAEALAREHPDTNRLMSAGVGPLDDWFVGPVARPIVALFAAIALVLVIACANVASLLLVRASERSREIAVRAALGASRGRIVRQLLVESCVLAMAGAALGIAVAEGLLRIFRALAPAGVPRLDEIALSPAVAAFAAGLAGLATIGVGLVPAWHSARESVRRHLGDGQRTTAAGVHRVRRMLVAGEVALAVVLLVGALTALRSFRALVSVDAGFPADGLIVAKVSLPGSRYGADGQAAAFFDTFTGRLRAEPGVQAAGATIALPLEGSAWTGDLFIERQPSLHGRELRHKSVTPGYLEALGVPLLAGRTIAESDRAGTTLVVVANAAFARTFFPKGDAVGARISFDDPNPPHPQKWTTIVGVVGDERQDSLAVPAVPEVFQAEAQEEFSAMTIAVRSARPAADVLSAIRRDLRAMDPQLALANAAPFRELESRSVTAERAVAAAIAVFAACALLLATIGVYGVAAGAVAGRLREIGIRLAFGATGRDVVGLIVRQEFAAVAVGLAAGGLAAAGAGRVVGTMFYGVTGHDARSFAGGALVLLVAGALACLLPARRALRVDPATTLRE